MKIAVTIVIIVQARVNGITHHIQGLTIGLTHILVFGRIEQIGIIGPETYLEFALASDHILATSLALVKKPCASAPIE